MKSERAITEGVAACVHEKLLDDDSFQDQRMYPVQIVGIILCQDFGIDRRAHYGL